MNTTVIADALIHLCLWLLILRLQKRIDALEKEVQ